MQVFELANPFCMPALGSRLLLTPIMMSAMNTKKSVMMKQTRYTARYPTSCSEQTKV